MELREHMELFPGKGTQSEEQGRPLNILDMPRICSYFFYFFQSTETDPFEIEFAPPV